LLYYFNLLVKYHQYESNTCLTLPKACQRQCCQLVNISAANDKSGPIKISAAGKIRGRIFGRCFHKWPKSGQTLYEVY
jgi:hypothetical protein